MDRHQKQLRVVLKPETKLRGEALPSDVQKVIVGEEHQQEWSSGLDQEDTKPPHIKEEQEELQISQDGEQIQVLEEADITKFPFTPVPVKNEDDEEKDCGGSEPAMKSVPDAHLQSDTDDETGDSSEPETNDSADWKETREPQSALNSLKRDSRRKKTFSCSECGKKFGFKSHLKTHMRIHTGEKPFSCSVCKKSFTQSGHLQSHIVVHTRENTFSCSVCNKRFAWHSLVKRHKCGGPMETEADGEDSGGPEPARDSHSHPLLQPETEDQNGDSSEPESDDRADWKETREPQSALNSLKHDSRRKKTFSCSECGKRFGFKSNLKRHMITHTGEKPFSCSKCGKSFTDSGTLKKHIMTHSGEKPFSCSVCKKYFTQNGNLQNHMRIHTGEKPFSCSVCKKSFTQRVHVRSHMAVHTGEKRFSCSVCNKRFAWSSLVKTHKCVGPMETEANGEDCGGPEPARNSHPLLQSETEDQNGDSSDPETDDME